MLTNMWKQTDLTSGDLGLRLIILAALMLSACDKNNPSLPANSGQEIKTSAQPASTVVAPKTEEIQDSKKKPNNCISSSGCIKWETLERQSAFKRMQQEPFTVLKNKTLNDLSKLIPPPRFDEVIKILAACSCDQGSLSVYQKPGNSKTIILARGNTNAEYPTVISVNESSTKEIKLDYGFMYESGHIGAITDVNNNGYVEFWLTGTVNECEDGCDGSGTAVIEESEDNSCLRAEPGDFNDVTAGFVDGTGKVALFSTPNGIALARNNLYVADTSNNRIRKIDVATGVVATLAGSNTTCPVDGSGNAASFNGPQGIVASGDNLYVTDTLNHKIRKVEIATGLVSTLAGSGEKGAADGTGTAATFNQPFGIATDGKNLYVTDSFNNKVRAIEIATGMVTTLAGSGRFDPHMAGAGTGDGCDDGVGQAASLCHPTGITLFDGILYVVDQANPRIRKINISSGAVTNFAGSGRYGTDDGLPSKALFSGSTGITNDGHYLFVSDSINYVRKVDMTTGVVSTLPNVNKQSIVWGVLANGKDLYVTTGMNSILKIDTSNNKTTTLAGFEYSKTNPMKAAAKSDGDNYGLNSK